MYGEEINSVALFCKASSPNERARIRQPRGSGLNELGQWNSRAPQSAQGKKITRSNCTISIRGR